MYSAQHEKAVLEWVIVSCRIMFVSTHLKTYNLLNPNSTRLINGLCRVNPLI